MVFKVCQQISFDHVCDGAICWLRGNIYDIVLNTAIQGPSICHSYIDGVKCVEHYSKY